MAFFQWKDAKDPKMLSYDDLCAQLKHIELGDGQRYYKYLCANLNAAARCRTFNEDMANESTGVIKTVRVAATVFRPELRTYSDKANDAAAKANVVVLKRIEDCLEHESTERQNIKFCSHVMYWDFTAAIQKLHAAWKEGCNASGKSCWHKKNLELIEYLYKRAHGEIRAKVMLTIGTKVPTELAEKIVEFTIAAEEVPLDGSIYEEETIPVPKHLRDHDDGKTTRTVNRPRGSKYCDYYGSL